MILLSIFNIFKRRKQRKKQNSQFMQKQSQTNQQNDTSGQADQLEEKYFKNKIGENIQIIMKTLGDSSDLIIRKLELPTEQPIQAAIIMIDGLINGRTVNENIIHSLISNEKTIREADRNKIFDVIEKKVLSVTAAESVYDWNTFFDSLLSGETLILIDGYKKVLATKTSGGEKRQITPPETEVSIRGPRDAFTESLNTNVALIRRRIKNPHLWLETLTVGKVNKNKIGIMYINGIANDKIVREVKKRIKRIDTDSIIESGEIEQFIEERTYTFFPTVFQTERPDVVAANLLEGRVAVLVSGSPFALTVPALFIEFFQAADDYSTRFDISAAIRILRILVFFISLVAPATYVAITTFHQEMIPTILIITIAAQREAVPFPAFVEAFIMEITFEILREAGVRLPRTIGQAVSIVGALVIGQAAVEAGIVSPAMVIVVAITAIASFATPSFSMAISIRLIRFILMFLAAFIGFYGMISGLMFMTLHLCSLRSYGVPYMSPLAPAMMKNLGDTLIRMPTWAKNIRPKLISQKNIKRQGNEQPPSPRNN